MFTSNHFGPLDHPRAGERILYRVRLRLIELWSEAGEDYIYKVAEAAAIGAVDSCLSQLWNQRNQQRHNGR